uniref:Uncharacterized protein n=1 Tax=Wuchereria bancrofti TaxID=6293 RepID=A0AAF5PVB7_WUCBA
MQSRPGLKGNKIFRVVKVKFLIRWTVIAGRNLIMPSAKSTKDERR